MNLNPERIKLLAESVVLDNPAFKGHIDIVIENMTRITERAVILAGAFPKERRNNIALLRGFSEDAPFLIADAVFDNVLSEALDFVAGTKSGEIINPLEELDELKDFHEHGFERGIELLRFPQFARKFRIAKREMTIFTGYPGHGKSEFVDQLMVSLADQAKLKFAVFSPENYPRSVHYEKWLSKVLGKPFHKGRTDRMTMLEIAPVMSWIGTHFTMIQPHEDNITLDSVLSLTSKAIHEQKIDCLLIDPWNELESARGSKQSETDYIGECLMKCRRFARINDIALWIVAHPYKPRPNQDGAYDVPNPYSISGSAHWANKADNCLTIFRTNDAVEVHIQKIKFKMRGETGVVKFSYDRVSGQYTEIPQSKEDF